MILKALNTPEERPPWGIATAVGSVLGGFVAVALVGSLVGVSVFPQNLANALPLGWLAGSLITIVLVYGLLRAPQQRAALRVGTSRLPMLTAFTLGFGVAIALDLIPLFLPGGIQNAPELSPLNDIGATALTWILCAVFVVILQPLAEEVVFRGVLFPALRASLGGSLAIVTATIASTVFHRLLYTTGAGGTGGFWYDLVEPFGAALLFSGLRAYSGGIRAPIVAHAAFGLFAVLKALALAG